MRDYEVVYILDSTLEREAVDEKIEGFHAALGGEITSVDHWGVRRLAYPIRKSETGYYVIVHVTADPVALPEFERLLRLDEETMRYLVVVNEGQPTSGASVPAERPRPPAPEDGGGGEDVAEAGDREDDDNEGPGGDGDGDQAPDDGAEDDKAEAGPPPSSGPPEFSGARGRRRRHEGPPIALLNYKDVTTLSRFLTEQGRILPKRTTKVTARFQRQLGTAVKRARFLALLPYVRDHGS